MGDQRVGAAFRAVRIRRGWRQVDVGARANLSHSAISLIERGHISAMTLETIRAVAAVLDIRVDVIPRWRGGELDRLLNARHSAMEEHLANHVTSFDRWKVLGEVSFAIYGERGSVDLLAWHAPTRSLLVIEIKTEIVDVQDLLGVMDRKVRLAPQIAREKGWVPAAVSRWIVVADSDMNRRRVAAHRHLIRSAFPEDVRAMTRWLKQPQGTIAAFSFLASATGSNTGGGFAAPRRVRRARVADR